MLPSFQLLYGQTEDTHKSSYESSGYVQRARKVWKDFDYRMDALQLKVATLSSFSLT